MAGSTRWLCCRPGFKQAEIEGSREVTVFAWPWAIRPAQMGVQSIARAHCPGASPGSIAHLVGRSCMQHPGDRPSAPDTCARAQVVRRGSAFTDREQETRAVHDQGGADQAGVRWDNVSPALAPRVPQAASLTSSLTSFLAMQVEWKLARGKFRPGLLLAAQQQEESLVIATSQTVFKVLHLSACPAPYFSPTLNPKNSGPFLSPIAGASRGRGARGRLARANSDGADAADQIEGCWSGDCLGSDGSGVLPCTIHVRRGSQGSVQGESGLSRLS